jgi:hypothetical protein
MRFQTVFQCNIINEPSINIDIKVKKNIIEISINLYDIPNLAKKVRTTLTRKRQFLQYSNIIDPRIDYDNPHYFKMFNLTVDFNQSVKSRHYKRISKEAISSEIDKIINFLDIVDFNLDIPATDILLTSLLR